MQISVDGIVVNQLGKVLLVRREGSAGWAMPGGGLAAGELPTESVRRAVREDTGLDVVPARLVGLYFRPADPLDRLAFVFRCLIQGGELKSKPDKRRLGYARSHELPAEMPAWQRERLALGLFHSEGPPVWRRQQDAALMRLVRSLGLSLGGQDTPFDDPSLDWQVQAFVVVTDQDGRALWQREGQSGGWRLPGGPVAAGVSPWDTAGRAARTAGLAADLSDLTCVYLGSNKQRLNLVFTARVAGGSDPSPVLDDDFAYFAPGQEEAGSLPEQVTWVSEAVQPRQATLFRRQSQEEASGGS